MAKWGQKEYAEHYSKRNPMYKCLPDNMIVWLNEHYSNVQFNVCNTDAVNGYGVNITFSVHVYVPFEKCNRCAYHSIWNPDDTQDGCRARGGRHRLQRGWDEVFSWTSNNRNRTPLETAFQEFLGNNNNEYRAMKKIVVA